MVAVLAVVFVPIAQAQACERPYADDSPWNTPVPADVEIDPRSATRMAAIVGPLSSDPTQYTYPVYYVSALTPREPVTISGWFSNVTDGGRSLTNQRRGSIMLPIPAGAAAAAGSDAQMILIDPIAGDEWGVWQLQLAAGGWQATNGYHYNIRWSGVPPLGSGDSFFVSRGAGVPYLTGLVRPCEILRGRIDHALAFAYDYPSGEFVYPATKSDGKGTGPGAMPEGTRLQLDPNLTEAQIRAWGCAGPCLTIARALQVYGMYVIDNAGRPKVMLEYEGTANWGGIVGSKTVNPIPLTAFRVIGGNTPSTAPPALGSGGRPPTCTIAGTPRRDVLIGTPARDVICAHGGNDVVYGRGASDVVDGGPGRDRLLGGAGADRLFGGRGADRIAGGTGADVLVGGSGQDVLAGGAGRDALRSRDGARDRVSGGSGRDRGRVDRRLDLVRTLEARF
jgi:hypothetical protein